MSNLPPFPAFFHSLWGFDPFPWQSMLAERVASGAWPRALDLPTASGKTACIEIALWALARQASRPLEERTAPRRIWFVVDRRIVVDEAFERARLIGEKLTSAADGPLKLVADRLREVSGTKRPVALARLRGGVFRDDGWARLPSQPAVITSTVDQLGSRILFRGYGRSHLAAPIFAGLAANDSLVLLDEAHCAAPFLQTLQSIELYRSDRWAEAPLRVPFAFVALSATPPPDLAHADVFPGDQRQAALDHSDLRQRLEARKPAELVQLKAARRGDDRDPLVTEAAARALQHVAAGKRRVAVMVNRVRTAGSIAASLSQSAGTEADIVLMTGRMRPFERDRLVSRWTPFLKAKQPDQPVKPIVTVSTQCLEVGADFSFEALITEAASLDALRQRFGRLDRMGEARSSPAVILIRERDSDPERSDPDAVYGKALANTWKLLNEHAEKRTEGVASIDFGVEPLREKLNEVDDLSPYLAPAPNAPVLLPAHLDMLCQTAPTPHPAPDVHLYLHGKDRGAPEVRVVWRSDLEPDEHQAWIEAVALCPPASGEMLSVPLHIARAWLGSAPAHDHMSDVEGAGEAAGESPEGPWRRCVLWRGRDRSRIAEHASEVAPGDVLIVPATYGMNGLTEAADLDALGAERLDLWELVIQSTGRPPAVRLNRSVLKPWSAWPPLRRLLDIAEGATWEWDELQEAIQAMLDHEPEEGDYTQPLPRWWLDLLKASRTGRIESHPGGGLVLVSRGRAASPETLEQDMFADDDDLTSAAGREVSLDDHTRMVARTVGKLGEHCVPDKYAGALGLGAAWHDAGKLDDRFQVLLHQGDELAALSAALPLAKSASIPASPARRQAIREATGLTAGFRHEVLSVQIAARHAPLPSDSLLQDLILHLIASHHGHARPFAPITVDPAPPAIDGYLNETHVELTSADRIGWIPHRVDSGLAERFWRLTRHHGWWGLAYLEAILRLGDWYASERAVEAEL